MGLVIHVWHEGMAKMVGKILDSPRVFYHETPRDTQYHFKTECSYPVDLLVVAYLRQQGVEEIHCTSGSGGLATTVTEIVTAPVHGWGNRRRYYLSDSLWREIVIDYEIPWFTEKVYLEEPVSRPTPFWRNRPSVPT